MTETQSIEQRILITMRQVLSTVIKEITPGQGMRHPLSKQTIEDVRQCFGLIAARERELNQLNGSVQPEKPEYKDEIKTTRDVHFGKKI